MSDRAVEVLAETLGQLWTEPEEDSDLAEWRALPGKFVAALKAAGIAVVELPKPHSNWDGSMTAWKVQQSWGGKPYRDGAVNIRVTDGKIIGDGVSNPSDCAADARSYAAALLAAADALEVSYE
jgi:hypothetical protein